MIVVDTNVLAYLLIDGERTADARALFSLDADWRSEPFILVEFTNILATAVRVHGLAPTAAATLLSSAERVVRIGTHAVAHHTALEIARRYSVSAYDARFLAVAVQVGARLVTEDARLRRAAPDMTWSLAEALIDA